MLLQASASIWFKWNPPPCCERSQLDHCFLGAGFTLYINAPVLFYPELHEEIQKLWMVSFTAQSCFMASSNLTTLDGGTHAIAVHLFQPPAYALHLMAILQVHQAKALKELYELTLPGEWRPADLESIWGHPFVCLPGILLLSTLLLLIQDLRFNSKPFELQHRLDSQKNIIALIRLAVEGGER